ncbi:MAG: M56 family metallopeptidase, partial [bacterium]|nr:M56 family metallopeptidase [bacterium]
METLLESSGFAFFVELFLKSSLVLGLALCFSFLLRKQSPAVRHLVLGLSLAALLLLPFLSAFMPGWRTGFLPSFDAESPEEIVIHVDAHQVKGSSAVAGTYRETVQVNRFPGEDETVPVGGMFSRSLSRYVFLALWFMGAAFMLGRILLGLYGASRLTRRGEGMNGYPWRQLFIEFLRKMSLKRNVRLVKNSRVTTPMTWGILRPVVLMPVDSLQWPVEQCSSVLFHELSHIKRWDFPVTLLARVACCLYWFNPLSWLVFRRLRKEQEKACDQMVLKTGIKPSAYASSLLRMKQLLDRGRYAPVPALGMAGRSELTERLTTILEKKIKIKEIKMKTRIILSILVFLTVTLIGTAQPYRTASVVDVVDEEVAVTAETPGTPGSVEKAETAPKAPKAQKEKKKEKPPKPPKAEKAPKAEKKKKVIKIKIDKDVDIEKDEEKEVTIII